MEPEGLNNDNEMKETNVTDEMEIESPATATAAAAAVAVRSYDCIFCKRGFSTAQALGGHMNIHRRDRASPRAAKSGPAYTAASSTEGHYRPYPIHRRSASFSSATAAAALCDVDFMRSYLPQDLMYGGSRHTTQTGSSSDHGENRKAKELRLFKEEDQLQLGLGLHGERGEVAEEKMDEEREGLDLELRLGQDPQ